MLQLKMTNLQFTPRRRNTSTLLLIALFLLQPTTGNRQNYHLQSI